MILLLGLILLSFIVLVHELGHFVAAKYYGVRVVSFSVGMGPKVLLGERWGTLFYLSAIPMGGYVRLVEGVQADGQVTDKATLAGFLVPISDSERTALRANPPSHSDSLCAKSRPQRAVILFAGVAVNLVFAWVAAVLLAVFFSGLHYPAKEVRVGTLGGVRAAVKAGLKEGDVLLSLNGEALTSWDLFGARLQQSKGSPIELLVQRTSADGVRAFPVTITPDTVTRTLPSGETRTYYALGFQQPWDVKVSPLWTRVLMGTTTFLLTPAIVAESLGLTTPIGLNTGPRDPNPLAESARPLPQFRGMIGGSLEIGYQASQGWQEALTLFYLLSIIVVAMNLFPYPATDGGELLMLALERFPRWSHGSDARLFVRQLGLGSMTVLFVIMCAKDVVDSIALAFLR